MKRPTGIVIAMPQPSPGEACDLELSALVSRPEFQTECVIGGKMPADMLARNKAKNAAFQAAQHAIIAKYGLFDEYLQPLIAEERRLEEELADVQGEIRSLLKLRHGR